MKDRFESALPDIVTSLRRHLTRTLAQARDPMQCINAATFLISYTARYRSYSSLARSALPLVV